jgi:signal transduction histidine kinase
MHSERVPTSAGSAAGRQRLERDLHDGVQNELVALIVKLAVAQEHPETPPALIHMLGELEVHAQVALDSVRNIARGIYPPQLADFGLREALRAQAVRVAIGASLVGTAPRSTEQAEEAVYFSCSEALQNAAKHARRNAHVTVRLVHQDEMLRVRIEDDGRGFDPARSPEGAGLRNIRDRIESLGGYVNVASRPGLGALLTLSVPWPAEGDDRR